MALTLNGSTGISGIAGSAGTPALQGTDTNTGYFFGTDILGLSTGGSERFRIDSSGRLGIGDNNPQSLLSIYDSANANDTPLIRLNSFRPAIRFVDRSSSSTESEIVADGNSLRFRIGEESDNNTALPELMRLKSDGKLGLGTVSPDQKLEVYNGAIKIDRRDNADTSNPHLEMRTGSSGGSRLLIYGEDHTDDNSNWIYKTNSNEDHIFHTGSTERLRIASSGFVGIGTSSPLRKLHVEDSNSELALFKSTKATGSYINFKLGANGAELGMIGSGAEILSGGADAGDFGIRAVGDLCISSGGHAEKMRLDSSGNLGIGTTSPSATLHCLKSGQINLIVGSSDAGGAYLVLDGDANGDSTGGDYAYIGHTTDGDLVLVADNPAGNGHIFLKSNGGTYQAVGCYESGEVQLRYQNTTKLETSSTGVILTSGAANTTSVRFGNTANRGLTISTYQSAGNNDSGVVLNAADSENSGYAATLEFDLGGVEFGRFDGNYDIFKLASACNGITFNGDWAAANRLNDYEEGTWTPALTNDGTMSTANGTYTKVGRLVHVKFSFTVNQINSASTNHVTGLPYSAAEQGYGQAGYFASLGSGATNAFNSISPYATGGTIYWNIITTANAFSQNPVMLGNSARCDGTITYTTN